MCASRETNNDFIRTPQVGEKFQVPRKTLAETFMCIIGGGGWLKMTTWWRRQAKPSVYRFLCLSATVQTEQLFFCFLETVAHKWVVQRRPERK